MTRILSLLIILLTPMFTAFSQRTVVTNSRTIVNVYPSSDATAEESGAIIRIEDDVPTSITATPESADRVYTIRTAGRGYIVCKGKGTGLAVSCPAARDKAAHFAFIPFETADGAKHTYIYNMESKKFLLHDKREFPGLVNQFNNYVRLGAKGLKGYLVDARVNRAARRFNEDAANPANIVSTEGYYLNCNNNGVCINTWRVLDEGNTLSIEDAGAMPLEQYIEAVKLLEDQLDGTNAGWQAIP